jgi:outer membrane protein, heavy metal efflux system
MIMRVFYYIPHLLVIITSSCLTLLTGDEYQDFAAARILDCDEALQKVLEASPALKMAETEIQIKMSEGWQVGLLPNPAISFEIDDIGGSNSCRWSDQGEFSITLSQIFELGGKRSARLNLAAANICLAIWSKEILMRDLRSKVMDAVIDVAIAQEKVKLKEAQSKLVEKSLNCALEKVKNGKASLVQQKKSEIAYSTSLLAHHKALGELNCAKRKLSSLWCSGILDYDAVGYPVYEIENPLPLECFDVENNPDVLFARMQVYAAREGYQLERSHRIPDLAVSAGYCLDNDKHNDSSFSLEFSFEIPVFDRNQGNICRASWETWQALYKQQDIETQISTNLIDVYGKWQKSAEIVQKIRKDALKEASEALKYVEQGYNDGKFDCQDYIDAQSNVKDIQDQLIDALAEYHHLKNEMQRLAPKERCDATIDQ